jgi:competence protein ComEC
VRYPAAPPALAVLLGTALGVRTAVDPHAAAAALAVAAGLCLVAWRERVAPAFVAAALSSAVVCGWTLGSTAAERALHAPLRAALIAAAGPGAVSDAPADPVTLVGTLTADAAPVETGVRLSLAVQRFEIDGRSHAAEGGVLLTVAGDAPAATVEQWRRGRTVLLPAQLRRPSRYLNPGARDDERALALRGTTLVGSVKSAMLVRLASRGGAPDEAAAAIRRSVRRVVDRRVGALSPRSAAIVRAILLGDRAGLDDDTEQRLQDAGTYHVLAISGGNIAVLAAVLLGAAAVAGLTPGAAYALVALLLAGYAFVVGGGASVVRATQMAVLYLAARAFDHRARPFNAVAASAGLSAAVDPLVVCDAGAWLTYGATIAILVGTPLLLTRVQSAGLAVRAPAGLLAASVSAELALFPVSALVFSRVTAAGLLLNFAAVPLMSAVQAAGLAVLAAEAVAPALVPAPAWMAHAAAWGLVESARLVDMMPWSVVRVPPPAPAAVAIYYGAWAAWFALSRLAPGRGSSPAVARWCRASAVLAIAASGAWIVGTPRLRLAQTSFVEATFIDVGQGAATLVRFPSGDALLVDAGGAAGARFDVGRRVVEPAVWAAGVHRLSHFVATHPDADHIGGAVSLVSDLRPREVWEGVPVPPDPLLRRLRLEAARVGAAWRAVQRGDRVRFGNADVTTWHPRPPEWERQRARNDDSVVVEVRFGEVSLLLPGDVESSAEAEVAGLLEPAGVRVMLAPHHGSATSSGWPLIRAAAPDLVVMSAGRGNRYSHPHASVLARYRAAGARILRTDVDGAVTVRTDGRIVEVATFTGRRLVLHPRRPAASAPPA